MKGPSCPGDHQATKGAPIGLETTKRPSGRLVARKGPREEKKAIKSKTGAEYHGCQIDEGMNQPVERKVALRTKSGEEGTGRVLCGCSADIVGAQIRIGMLRHPQRDVKLHPCSTL